MLCITCPDDDAKEVFEGLAVHTRDRNLRAALLLESNRVSRRATEYLHLADQKELYLLPSEEPVGVTVDQLAGLYARVFVKGNGRPMYDRLKAAAKFNRCPLCGQRDVKTLDHYLPKSIYPELSVFPANLVPSCTDCNKVKLDHQARTYVEQTFHPYFDDWSNHQILHADVSVDHYVKVNFAIGTDGVISPQNLRRAQSHFEMLNLDALYTGHAAVELVQSKETFRRNFNSGVEVLRSELRHTAQSRQNGNLNSWVSALYRALASNDEFCNGGFELIEE